VIDGFIADFYCHAARLVIEIDGPVHDRQIEYDRERDLVLMGRGLRVLRVTNSDVNGNLSDVLVRIAAAALSGLTYPPAPSPAREGETLDGRPHAILGGRVLVRRCPPAFALRAALPPSLAGHRAAEGDGCAPSPRPLQGD